MKNVLFGAVLATLLIPMPARAQGDHRVHLTIGGGFTMPVSDIDERFDTGGGFNIGMTIETGPVFEIQTEYSYNALAGKDKRIPLFGEAGGVQRGEALIESHHAMHYINFNGVLKTAGESKVKPYGVGGGGMYYRSVSLTTPDVGFTTYCDPYWYACYPTAVEIDRVVGDRSGWDPGIDLGGGVAFALGDAALFYVETRWHYMWGPEFTDTEGVVHKANGQYFPVTFGFRF
jgi:opacity protein-like surface antigen